MGIEFLRRKGTFMDFAIAGIISLFIAGYLVFTLFYPEKF